MLAHSALLIIGIFIVIYFFTDKLVELLISKNAIKQMLSLSVGLLILALAVFGIILVVPQIFGGAMLLAKARSGKIWGIVAGIFATICLPIGTVVGIYGLWFLLGEKGKEVYDGSSASKFIGERR